MCSRCSRSCSKSRVPRRQIEIAQKGCTTASRAATRSLADCRTEAAKLAYGAIIPMPASPNMQPWRRSRAGSGSSGTAVRPPQQYILGVVRTLIRPKMEARLARGHFAAWPWARGDRSRNQARTSKPGYYQVDKTDVNQATFKWWPLASRARIPITLLLSVFNEAFGGGFSAGF